MTPPSDVAWIAMSVPGFDRCVCVTFNEDARVECLTRYPWDVVITWDECVAWATGLLDVSGAARAARSLEALAYFAARQGLSS